MEASFSKHLVHSLSVVLGINENKSLSGFASFEYFFEKIELFALFAFILELLNMVQFELLGLDFDL